MTAQQGVHGLTTVEAGERRKQYGANALPESKANPWTDLAKRLWGPIPWMLEAALALELFMGRHVQAGVIAALLVTNAVVAFFQERKAGEALALLRQQLDVKTRVMRDGAWCSLSARELVPGDLTHLRVGDIAPADATLLEGQLLLDTSTLTGESMPREAKPGDATYAGTVVVRGEADALVDATGTRTRFGKTAELVRAGSAPGHIERVVVSVARALVAVDLVLVAVIVAYAVLKHLEPSEVAPYCLILLVASVPVALPATFSLALALGARELAEQGILVTRLAALEDLAGMDVLCTDKTGTLTQNLLSVGGVKAFGSRTPDEVLALAAMASDAATQDPLDLAILRGSRAAPGQVRLRFVPFDPLTRRSEAFFATAGAERRVVKGAPSAVSQLVTTPPKGFDAEVLALASAGNRVLAVAAGDAALELVGLVGLMDAPRDDTREAVAGLHALGIRLVMATGDAFPTAQSIARAVGLSPEGQALIPGAVLSDASLVSANVLAGVFPEDKFRLVGAHQRVGHITGMTGDGVNDAPALRQAEVGIAVSNAVDVAKAAASVVLTRPGLSSIEPAVLAGRRVFSRMRTYTLNKIIKTLQVSVFLTVGLLWTGEAIVTPRLILLLLFANDFVTMALSADRVTASLAPEQWNVRGLVRTASLLAAGWLTLGFAGVAVARTVLNVPLPQLQTLSFLMLVFTGQATVYLAREKGRFWKSTPGAALLWATGGDLVIVSALALSGTWMAAVPWQYAAGLFLAVLLGAGGLDELKVRLLSRGGTQ